MLKDDQVLIVEKGENKDNAIKMMDKCEFVVTKDKQTCTDEQDDEETKNYSSNKDENCQPALTLCSSRDSASPCVTTSHLDEQDEFNNESIQTDNCQQQLTDDFKIEQSESRLEPTNITRFDNFDSMINNQLCNDNDTMNQCQQNLCHTTDNEFDSNQYDVNLNNDNNVQLVKTFGTEQVNNGATNDDDDDFGDFADFSNAPNISSPYVEFVTIQKGEPTCAKSPEKADNNDVDDKDFGDVQSFNYTNADEMQLDETFVCEKKIPVLSESNKSVIIIMHIYINII